MKILKEGEGHLLKLKSGQYLPSMFNCSIKTYTQHIYGITFIRHSIQHYINAV